MKYLNCFALSIMMSIAAVASAPFSAQDMLSFKRVGEAQLSPDSKIVAFTIGVLDLEANGYVKQVYVKSVDGEDQRQLTDTKSSSASPSWSKDGKQLAYSNNGQLWVMQADGKSPRQITSISTEADGPVWSPDGKWILFNSNVYPSCDSDACNKAEAEKEEKNPVKAHVAERLLYRHWDEWRDRKRSHVFVVSSQGGLARDLTPGDFDSPPYGARTGTDYAFSPDGNSVVYLRNPDPIEATSTNSDIYLRPLLEGSATNVTEGMNGYDLSPVFTPDGRYLLFRSQATPGFESDRFRIMRMDLKTREKVELTKNFDQTVDEFTVSSDSRLVYFAVEERGRVNIFSVPIETPGEVKKVVVGVDASSLNLSRDGKTLVFVGSSFAAPPEVMSARTSDGKVSPVTQINTLALKQFALKKAEDLEWKGALSNNVHGFLVKPANFDATKKYPLIVVIHGGPQAPFFDAWSTRWNPQIFANAGYVVFLPNPRGSPGYGQRFTDEVSGDWGGKAFVDIMNGVANVIRLPFIDAERIGAAGASYGGFMIDWILGHNNDSRFKFKALVSHAGVYNLESMAGATEELWFVNWEFKGMPWENRANYDKWSPNHFVRNFSTPTLVICGEHDYRVPNDQSFQLFTALQLQKVPSKLIVFPDEGHWILKPQNALFWNKNVLEWFAKYL